MANETPELIARVNSAMGHNRADDVIEGVKDAIAAGIRAVDPKAHPQYTRFFNHSYQPDMIIHWDGTEGSVRPVFLRGSLGDGDIRTEIDRLGPLEPIVIGLQADKKKQERRLRPAVARAATVLATDVAAVSQVRAGASMANSLSRLVRTNLLKEGRGYLGLKETARIARVNDDSADGAVKAFGETVDALFNGAPRERLSRTATLLRDLINPETSASAVLSLEGLTLTANDLALVLPVVLQGDPKALDDGIWSVLGNSISLGTLESLASDLVDLDLTPLIVENAARFWGERARPEANANIVDGTEGVADIARWVMRGGLLTAEIANQAIFLSASGYKFKRVIEGVDARWENLSERLDDFDVASVELHGLSDRFSVAGEDAARVRANVATVSSTIRDQFHVPSIELRERGAELHGTLRVDFQNVRVERQGGQVSVRALVLAAALLDRDDAMSRTSLEALVGLAEDPNDAEGAEAAEDVQDVEDDESPA